jgi:hypothetical protein
MFKVAIMHKRTYFSKFFRFFGYLQIAPFASQALFVTHLPGGVGNRDLWVRLRESKMYKVKIK